MARTQSTIQQLVWSVAFGVILASVIGPALASAASAKTVENSNAKNSTMANVPGEITQCAGRFAFQVPQTMSVAGRAQSIYLTNVTTIPVPPGGVDAYWSRKLADMGIVQARKFAPEPDVKAAWSARNPTLPRILTLELVKPFKDSLLLVNFEANAGKEGTAETLVKDIVGSYVPANTNGFCVGYGAITLEPSQNEQARLALSDANATGIEITFQTRTVREPDTKTYSDVDEERAMTSAAGGTLDVVVDRERSVARLRGKEIRISVKLPAEKPKVRFTWHYPGTPQSSTQPAIDVVGSGPTDQADRLVAVWELILTSLRPLPVGPSR